MRPARLSAAVLAVLQQSPATPCLLALALALLLGAACAGPAQRACNDDIECASGRCSNGRCAPLDGDSDPSSGDGDASQGEGDGDASHGDGDEPAGGDAPGDGDPAGGDGALCQPDNDGTITRAELFFTPGLSAQFALARDVSFDTAGSVGEDGVRRWDFSVALAGDVEVTRTLLDLSDVWFFDPDDPNDSYAGATHALEVPGDDDHLGVYEASDDGLLLRGLVSLDGGYFATELTYSPPLATLELPLELGAGWESAATVSGWLNGGYSLYWEDARLDVEIDAAGIAVTALAELPVLRVRSVLTRQTGALTPTVVRTYAFVTECYGTVAWVVSHADEAQEEFTGALEVGRIVP